MSNYADLIERLVEGKSSYIDPLARDLWNRDGFEARDAISRLEREKAELRNLVEDIEASLTADNTYRLLREACQSLLSRTQEQTA